VNRDAVLFPFHHFRIVYFGFIPVLVYRDAVLLGGPVPEIDQFAAVGAKRPVAVFADPGYLRAAARASDMAN